MTLQDDMKQWLEALECSQPLIRWPEKVARHEAAITSLRARIESEQPRKPLSDEHALRIVMEACEQAGAIITTNAAVIAARTVERAHNITEESNAPINQ